MRQDLKHRYLPRERRHVYLRGKDDVFTLSDEQIDLICESYVKSGRDLPQQQVAEILDISMDDLKYILYNTFEGINKSSEPISPAKVLDIGVEKTVAETLRRKKRLVRERLEEARARSAEADREKAASLLDEIKDVIRKVVKPECVLLPTKFIPINSSLASKTYVYTDWHVGSKTARRTSRYKGYNKDIFKTRIAHCMSKIENKDSIECAVNVVFLGDLLDGPLGNMHKNQAKGQDLREMDQINHAADGIVSLITKAFSVHGGVINMFAVGGNHDRVTMDRKEDPTRFGHQVLMEIVRLRLDNYTSRGLVRIFDTNEKFQGFNASANVRLILNHGDNNAKAPNLVTMDGVCHSGYKVILQGHLHKRFIEEGNGYMKVITPSLMGGSDFAQDELALASRPGQSIVRVYDDGDNYSAQVEWVDLPL